MVEAGMVVVVVVFVVVVVVVVGGVAPAASSAAMDWEYCEGLIWPLSKRRWIWVAARLAALVRAAPGGRAATPRNSTAAAFGPGAPQEDLVAFEMAAGADQGRGCPGAARGAPAGETAEEWQDRWRDS